MISMRVIAYYDAYSVAPIVLQFVRLICNMLVACCASLLTMTSSTWRMRKWSVSVEGKKENPKKNVDGLLSEGPSTQMCVFVHSVRSSSVCVCIIFWSSINSCCCCCSSSGNRSRSWWRTSATSGDGEEEEAAEEDRDGPSVLYLLPLSLFSFL